MYFVFDAYGTLLDVNAAAREAAQEPEMAAISDQWQSISSSWREKQLRYSWLCSMMGKYNDFWSLTMRALDSTLEEHGLLANGYERERLLGLYSRLSAFDEVRNVLANENHGQAPERCHIHAFENLALICGAITVQAERHVVVALFAGVLECKRVACGSRDLRSNNTIAAKEPLIRVVHVHRPTLAL